ncbi:MAG: hypothetical protein FJ121_03980 [Deltaproteobacteria bacterium]|nr:hypothetical protein [Deltaproteobacteria bacterium]
MRSGRKNLLTKQIGEYLVAAELGRKGLIATTFTGNVPDFDILATNETFKTIPIQVKTIWGPRGAWQLDAENFINIDITNGFQKVIGKKGLSNPDLICIFVRLTSQGDDEFYIFRLSDLQESIVDHYSQNLEKHGGKRPRNENSTHISINPEYLKRFEGNWGIILNQKSTT